MRVRGLSVLALLFPLAAASACRRAEPPGKDAAAPQTPPATPVRAAPVVRAGFDRLVIGTGRTVALVQQKIRPPFAGILTELGVVDGDRVRRGQRLGTIVSRDSQAALDGADQMLREARTEAETSDAQRAVELARRNLVTASLVSPADGAVAAHAANAGDRVAEDQDLLTISASDSLVFQADVPQPELPAVRAGEPATVELAGRSAPVAGTVHDVLPSANAADLTVPVRIDFGRLPDPLPVGLFGTARIRAGRVEGAAAVPAAAVMRDDVTGKTRVAVLEAGHRARWTEVTAGLAQNGLVQIVAPALPPGTRVLIEGQVGLPDGAAVSAQP